MGSHDGKHLFQLKGEAVVLPHQKVRQCDNATV